MDLALTGRRALVTGASEGIGAEIARHLASEGCDLYMVARSADRLEALRQEIIAATGRSVIAIEADMGARQTPQDLARQCSDSDILVNNAGAVPAGYLHEIDDNAWRSAWEVKVFGYINLVRTIYPNMKKRGGGVIINIIGTGGERPTADYVCGATANAALMAFTRAVGGQSLDDGIRMVGINPGPVATVRLEEVLTSHARARLGDPNRWRELLTDYPEGRAATTTEIAATVVFLASMRSSYTSGAIVTIDGGTGYRTNRA